MGFSLLEKENDTRDLEISDDRGIIKTVIAIRCNNCGGSKFHSQSIENTPYSMSICSLCKSEITNGYLFSLK